MIIWIRNRKGWIGGVFFLLAGIFALSFVIGGVGTGNQASLSDIFGNSGGGSAGTTTGQPEHRRRFRRRSRPSPRTRRPGRISRTRTRAPRARGRGRRVEALCGAQARQSRRPPAPGAGAGAGGEQLQQPGAELSAAGFFVVARQRQHVLGRHARLAHRGPREPGPGGSRERSAEQGADQGGRPCEARDLLVEAVGQHLRQDRGAAGLREERSRSHRLAQLRFRGAERERHEGRDQGLRRVPQARARRHQRTAGEVDPQATQSDSTTHDS